MSRRLTSYSSFAMAAVSGGGDAQRGGVLEKAALDRRRVGVGGVRQSAECRGGRERASTYVVRGRWSGCLLPRQSNRGDSCGRCAKSKTALAWSPLVPLYLLHLELSNTAHRGDHLLNSIVSLSESTNSDRPPAVRARARIVCSRVRYIDASAEHCISLYALANQRLATRRDSDALISPLSTVVSAINPSPICRPSRSCGRSCRHRTMSPEITTLTLFL